MRNKKKRMIAANLAALFLLGCILGASVPMKETAENRNQSDSSKHYVAVITKSTTSAYWKSVFSGANAAGTEYNLELTFEGPENEEDYEAQNTMIDKAVNAGAEVIVFSAVDFHANAEAINNAAKCGVKIVVIDSDVDSAMVSCRISTDNYQAGYMAGEALLKSREAILYTGIVNFDKNSANGQQREKGFLDAVKQDDRVTVLETVNVRSSTEDACENTKYMLQRHPQINAIVTFNEWTSLGVGYAVSDLGMADETMVVAFDSNVVSVGMLETGEVDALIVQNPYAMGYLGIECAYNLIFNQPIKEAQVNTTTTMVTRENMFDAECQRALFSFGS